MLSHHWWHVLPESNRLRSILHVVLYMTELVMSRLKVLERDARAHADTEIASIVEIPGCGVTHNIAIGGFLQHGQVPEGVRHTFQPHRAVEVVGHAKHALHRVVLTAHFIGRIAGRFLRVRLADAV